MKKCRTSQSEVAFSLIELIGVLTVIAILAAVLVPVLIRQMDKMAGDQESASLKSIGDALQQSIMRNRYIPSDSDWATNIAIELGVNISNVKTNGRKQPRFFLIDPGLQVGVNGGQLPYLQTVAGSVVNSGGSVTSPISPRVLILSSIGQRLTNMQNGIPAVPSDFTNIWDAPDGTLPLASSLAGLTRPDDLKVQRVNLSTLFVRLVLTTYASSGIPRYSIDNTNLGAAIIVTNLGVDAYFIQNSGLTLFANSSVDSQYILIRDNSLVFNLEVWRASIIGGLTIGGLDIATVVDKFLKAPPNLNPNVPTNQPTVVVTNMMNYMSKYDIWAATGFTDANAKSTARTANDDMITAIQKLFDSFGGTNYTPWNTNACVVQ